jgi:DNA replication initiation complex subunit (GINS family)
MKTYGPFNPEDVATLPEENAENLIRRGFAKVVEIQP